MSKKVTKKTADTHILQANSITKSFGKGERRVDVLTGVDLHIYAGETVALLGPSGCGKTTLLQILGLLDHADSGTLCLQGKDVSRISESERTHLRRDCIGFVYQYHHLLPECSALENVILPQMIAGISAKKAAIRAKELLALLELSDRSAHRPAALSGGQQQRVAIARALANSPALLLTDEPTGNLDPHTAAHVMEVLLKASRDTGTAIIMVSHNHTLASQMQRTVQLDEGRVV